MRKLLDSALKSTGIALIMLLILAALANIQYGIDSIDMMRVFSADEPRIVEQVSQSLKKNSLDPEGIYNYGYFYQTVCYYTLRVFESLGFASNKIRFIASMLRFISLITYCLLLLTVYKLFLFLNHDRSLGIYAVTFLASIPSLFYWSQMVHPDLLQAFLITLAALIVFSQHSFSRAVYSSIVLGIAFGTKYSSIFFLPFVILPSSLLFFKDKIEKNLKIAKKDYLVVFGAILAIILSFSLAWLITNPYIISNTSEFIKDFQFEKNHVARGHGFAESTNSLLWFSILFSDFKIFGTFIVGAGVVLLVFFLGKIKKKTRNSWTNHSNRTLLTILIYIIFSLIYLMISVNMRQPRFLFHILPFITILGFSGIAKVKKYIPQKLHLLIHIAIIGFLIPFSLNTIRSTSSSSKKYQHPFIKATEWIENNYSTDVRILADYYSYRSPRFTNYLSIWGVTEQMIKKYKPVLIIINENLSGRWTWKKQGTDFRDLQFIKGKDDGAQTFHEFHLKLFSKSSSFKVVYENTTIVILEDTQYSSHK